MTKIILTILLIFLAVLGGYYLVISKSKQTSPSTQNTTITAVGTTQESSPSSQITSWKTYTNKKYGFSFKYPQDFYLNEGYTKEYDASTINLSNTKSDEFYNSPTNIHISINISPKDFKGNKMYYNSCCAFGWIQTNYTNMINTQNGSTQKSLQNSLTKIDALTIDNVNIVRFKLTKDHINEVLSIPTLYAAFIKNDIGFIIGGNTSNPDLIFEKKYFDLFNQILSTFKFTN